MIPWGHHFLLLEKIKDVGTRFWYMQQVLEQGWSRDVLVAMIKSNVHKRHGKATSNFKTRLPAPLSLTLYNRLLKIRTSLIL